MFWFIRSIIFSAKDLSGLSGNPCKAKDSGCKLDFASFNFTTRGFSDMIRSNHVVDHAISLFHKLNNLQQLDVTH